MNATFTEEQTPQQPFLRMDGPILVASLQALAEVEDEFDGWAIETIREPGGEMGLAIMPESGNDADGPTLIIWPLETSFRVVELHWDAFRTVGHYRQVSDVLLAITPLLLREPEVL